MWCLPVFTGTGEESAKCTADEEIQMSWTEERVDLLKKLWADGLSASQIAAKLGGVTRNAVIGKVHRLKLSSRGRTTSSTSRTKKSSKSTGSVKSSPRGGGYSRSIPASVGATALQHQYATDAVARVEMKRAEEVVVPISRRLSLTELSEATCKWPIGDPLTDDFHFCGNDPTESGPYCAYHSRLAFQPASERKRSR